MASVSISIIGLDDKYDISVGKDILNRTDNGRDISQAVQEVVSDVQDWIAAHTTKYPVRDNPQA